MERNQEKKKSGIVVIVIAIVVIAIAGVLLLGGKKIFNQEFETEAKASDQHLKVDTKTEGVNQKEADELEPNDKTEEKEVLSTDEMIENIHKVSYTVKENNLENIMEKGHLYKFINDYDEYQEMLNGVSKCVNPKGVDKNKISEEMFQSNKILVVNCYASEVKSLSGTIQEIEREEDSLIVDLKYEVNGISDSDLVDLYFIPVPLQIENVQVKRSSNIETTNIGKQ